MQLRLAVCLSCIGLLGACSSDSGNAMGTGTGGGAIEDVRHTSLATLKLTSDVVVEGTITAVVENASGASSERTVSMNVEQTLWSMLGTAPAVVSFSYIPDGDADHAPVAGEVAIVFLHESAPGAYAVNGGATGRFRIADGVVQPVVTGGVALPPDTDLAEFVALLDDAEVETPTEPVDITYVGGGGY